MGSKKAGNEAHDRGKLKEIEKSKDIDRRAGFVSEGVGSSPSDLGKKKKHKSHGTLDNDVEQNGSQMVAVNADRDTRNDDQKKNKKKRKREQSGDDKENQRLGNTNETCENSEVVCQTGKDLQEKKKNKKVKSLKDNDMESEDRETKKKKKEEEVRPPKENGVECEDRKTEKKKKKNKKKEWEEEVKSLKDNVVELEEGKTEKKKKKRDEEVEFLKDNDVELEDRKTEKKKKKKEKKKEEEVKSRKGDDVELESKKTEKKKNKEEVEPLKDNDVELENRKTEKKKRKKGEEVVPLKDNDVESENRKSEKKKKKKREKVIEPLKENDVELGDRKSEKKKKVKSAKGDSQSTSGASASIAKREDSSNESNSKRKKKSVSFAEDVVVFPSSNKPDNECEGDLVRGKRFSPEEDKLLTWAVENYIDEHQLGEEGIKMVLNCRKHPEVKDCWKEIGAALPWRPKESVYYRAHILFERGTDRTWTPEELEHVRKFYEEHGANWKKLAGELGKHRFHVKDAWRRIKLPNQKRGVWSQDEYQKLFDLVNADLRLRALEEKKSKHGMLRDNISWGAVSDKLESRSNALCCMKWYNQLSSPMVAEGKWLDTDDYHLLMELYELDACCMEDVEWDNLLEHRSGDVCRKRWTQMVKHLGEHKDKSFAEQVEVLIGRYCPDVLEAREAYNKKEAVDS